MVAQPKTLTVFVVVLNKIANTRHKHISSKRPSTGGKHDHLEGGHVISQMQQTATLKCKIDMAIKKSTQFIGKKGASPHVLFCILSSIL